MVAIELGAVNTIVNKRDVANALLGLIVQYERKTLNQLNE